MIYLNNHLTSNLMIWSKITIIIHIIDQVFYVVFNGFKSRNLSYNPLRFINNFKIVNRKYKLTKWTFVKNEKSRGIGRVFLSRIFAKMMKPTQIYTTDISYARFSARKSTEKDPEGSYFRPKIQRKRVRSERVLDTYVRFRTARKSQNVVGMRDL